MTVMAQLSTGLAKGIFGAAVLSLTFVAVASGRDLIHQGGPGSLNSSQPELTGISATINRTGKADRSALATGSGLRTRTVAMRLNDLANTSVMIRIPVAPVAQEIPRAPASLLMKSGESKPTAGCEPMVSVLTEVAKRLPPGRCVT
jgi:hypothetical protein